VTEFTTSNKKDIEPGKFFRHNSKAIKPFYSTYLATGLDLCIPDAVAIQPQETKQIGLGFTLIPPQSHGFSIRPRSSLSAIGLRVNYGTVGKRKKKFYDF